MIQDFKWRSTVDFPSYPFKIHYQDKLFLMGSCFATAIGSRLVQLKYQAFLQPFGIQYHAMSISEGLDRLLQQKTLKSEELIQHQDLWHSWLHHGSFSKTDKSEMLAYSQKIFEQAYQHLMETDYLIITLGSSWVYLLKNSGQIVNNCHKFPATHFRRKILSIEQMVEALASVIEKLRKHRPQLQVISSVSPVRHLKDGAIENQRSKARLLLVLEELTQQFDYWHYFPAYEILLDELRDYRFYSADLTHPSPITEDYIWSKFAQHCLAPQEASWRKRVYKLKKSMAHQPLHPERAAYKNFLQTLYLQQQQLSRELPCALSWEEENNFFKKQDYSLD